MPGRADVVVVGAGIAGISAAYFLSVVYGVGKVVIVDPRPPLTLTSDKSTECYRNWWPNRPMVGLMNRSIDLVNQISEQSGDTIGLSRRGYLFVTGDCDRLDAMADQAVITSTFGGGEVRQHPGPEPYVSSIDGVDFLSPSEIATHFPYVTPEAVGAMHVRKAGWFSAQQLGAWTLERARDRGAELVTAEVTDIDLAKNAVTGVRLSDNTTISTGTLVVATGPLSQGVAAMAGVDLPLYSELHLKVAFREHLQVIPRDAPMLIWSDPQRVNWSTEEREGMEDLGRHDLLGDLPQFCHGRPEGSAGSPYFLALWEYHNHESEPVWPIPEDPFYPEVVMRGLTTMIPGLEAYCQRFPESFVDGGYYTKTVENRPLIGPAGPEGIHLVCGMSGFGVMAAAGAGDLAARHISGQTLPDYSPDFLLSRYERPEYRKEIAELQDSGQL